MRQLPTFWIVITLWIAGLCAAAQFAKVGLMLPELAVAYPEAGIGLGFIVSSVSIIGVLFGLIAGIVAGRLGSRNLLLSGLLLGSVMSFAQASGCLTSRNRRCCTNLDCHPHHGSLATSCDELVGNLLWRVICAHRLDRATPG